VRRIWLFALAITIHNVPEGNGRGRRLRRRRRHPRVPLAVGIGLQNGPGGLAVAAGLVTIGYAPTRAFGVNLGTGVLEAFGELLAPIRHYREGRGGEGWAQAKSSAVGHRAISQPHQLHKRAEYLRAPELGEP
jgi:hypothetical protein